LGTSGIEKGSVHGYIGMNMGP